MNPQQRRDLYLEEMGLGQRWLLRARERHENAVPEAAASQAAPLAAQVVTADWLVIGPPAPDSVADGTAPAGKLLLAMLRSIDLEPPQNVRLASINSLINKEILQGEARLVLVLGQSAAHSLLATAAGIEALRGQVHRYQDLPLIVTYHPEDLLRSPMDKAKAWEDLLLARRTMRALIGT
jgi:DNA polymerase III psi subunit